MRDCAFCAEDGRRVEACQEFDWAACCQSCYDEMMDRAEEQTYARDHRQSYDDERAAQADLQRDLK